MVIKRVGALSLAKVAAVLYAGIGLIIGAMFSLIGLAGVTSNFTGADTPGASMFGAIFGVGAIVLLPICYAIFGFIGTLIGAVLFNFAARLTGGVEIEVQ